MTHPALLVVIAEGLFSILDAIMKGLSARYPVLQISWMRFVAGLLFAALFVLAMRPGWPSRETVIANGLRSLLVVVTATSFFYALSVLPLAETFALSFLSPLFTVLLGVLILGERMDGRIAFGLATGLVGMLAIVGGRLGTASASPEAALGAAAAVLAALVYAASTIMLRTRATRDPLSLIVVLQHIGPVLLLAPAAAAVARPVAAIDVLLFLLVGALGVSGHLLLARALREAEATRLAPLHYITLVWAIIFGYAFYDETPAPMMLAGAGLIIAGSLWAQRR